MRRRLAPSANRITGKRGAEPVGKSKQRQNIGKAQIDELDSYSRKAQRGDGDSRKAQVVSLEKGGPNPWGRANSDKISANIAGQAGPKNITCGMEASTDKESSTCGRRQPRRRYSESRKCGEHPYRAASAGRHEQNDGGQRRQRSDKNNGGHEGRRLE
jgi:hypothetical protein